MEIEEIMKEDPELTMEFIYATRIVEALSKVNLKTECDQMESIKMIERSFLEFKNKLTDQVDKTH